MESLNKHFTELIEKSIKRIGRHFAINEEGSRKWDIEAVKFIRCGPNDMSSFNNNKIFTCHDKAVSNRFLSTINYYVYFKPLDGVI